MKNWELKGKIIKIFEFIYFTFIQSISEKHKTKSQIIIQIKGSHI